MDSPLFWYWLVPSTLVLLIAVIGCARWVRHATAHAVVLHARELFQQQRPQLENLFFQAASASGKPRGLRWKECQWDNLLEWARDKKTGQLLAFAGVTIAFEAIEGSDMEGVAAVGNLRNATAVFLFQDGRWETAGRVIYNLNPAEALQHFSSGYERIPY